MKKVVLLIWAFTISLTSASGQSIENIDNPLRSIGIASIYDYTLSLTESETPSRPAADTVIHYMYASSDSSSYAITPADNLDELLPSLCVWNDLLIVVHGYGDGIVRLTNREPLLSGLYDVDVLVFSWPAYIKKGSKVSTFRTTKENIDSVMPMFNKFLGELSLYVQKKGIHCSMLFHSLGNRFAMLLGEEIAKGETLPDLSFIDHIILNQACVPLKDYQKWAVPLSEQIQGTLNITYNQRDMVLSIARSFSEKERQLGQGPTKKIPFVTLPKIRYFDFTKILKNEHLNYSHNFYARQPEDNPEKAEEIVEIYREML
jgi:hypothetical protein